MSGGGGVLAGPRVQQRAHFRLLVGARGVATGVGPSVCLKKRLNSEQEEKKRAVSGGTCTFPPSVQRSAAQPSQRSNERRVEASPDRQRFRGPCWWSTWATGPHPLPSPHRPSLLHNCSSCDTAAVDTAIESSTRPQLWHPLAAASTLEPRTRGPFATLDLSEPLVASASLWQCSPRSRTAHDAP